MEREFWTVVELAAMFDYDPETIMRRARSGELPAFKFGKNWYFPKAEVSALIRELSSTRHLRRNKEKQ